MKLHSKTIFVLLGTLAIGIAIGALGQSTLHNQRMEKLNEIRRQGGLYAAMDRYIDPVDQAQEDTLRALTKEYQNKLGRFYRHYQWHRSSLMDSLKTDVMPLLTPEQTELIAPWFERSTWRPDSTRSRNSADSSTSDSTSSKGAVSTDSSRSNN